MRKWKRYAGLALAGMMALSAGGVAPLASPDTEGDAAGSGTVQTETVEIGSDVWETPVIPDAPVSVAGVSETEISLNDTAGNGTWKFLFDIPDYTLENGVPYPTEENQDFDFTAWEDKNWQNIIVPGEPLMQGFDVLTNNEYYYQREITIPEDFAGNRVLVRFDGVYSNARVWINGKHIRTHVGGFTTWDCDITEYAAPGETVTMTVGVAELYSTTKGIWNPEGKSVNNPANATEYAHHDMTGILRDVSLVAMPYDYIARTYVNTDFDENFVNADLEVTAQLGLVSGDATLKIELVDGDTVVTSAETDFQRKSGEGLDVKNLPELVEEATGLLDENADNLYDSLDTAENGQYSREKYEAMETERDEAQAVLDSVPEEYLTRNSELTDAVKITIPVTAPKQWDAEHPNLYTLRTTLTVDGETVQVNEEKIGFREIQYNGADGTDHNKVYVNGKEVKLRGTCRHDVSDDLGRSMTREEAYAEAQAYKNANINFIRTSHYPASENLLDACDELGIYVEQETAVCFQGPWADVASKYEDFLPQFTEIIERDRNRACILIWSLGNESNYNKVASQSGGNAIQDEKDYLSDVDTSRPCIFSFPDTGEPADLADIYSVHYASVSGGLGSSTDGKPVLHDEFAHIPCYDLDELQRDANTRNFWGESIKIGWENIFETDGALGAALWGGIDDVFYIPEGTTERWQSHSDGQTAGYGEWGSVLDAYLREKPEAYLTKKAYSPVRVDEENCYVSAGTLYIPVKNWFDHTDLNEVELVVTTDAGEQRFQIAESIAPHSEGVITAAANIAADAQTVNLKFYTADGVMVDEYNVELAKVEYSFAPASETPPTIAGNDDTITINGEGFALVFSKTTGLITSGTFDGKDGALLTGGPYLHVTGATLGEWTPAEENGITAEIQDNKYAVVTLNGSYANGQGVQFVLTISGNGIIKTDYTLTTAPATTTGLSEVGISYDIPSDMESVSWLRDGLYSAYPEDHIGRNKGTALKEREGSDENPDKYGVEPEWSWKDDMMNYFIWATDDPNNGLATNDFRTMRENVYYYNVNYGSAETSPRISVESENADVAARVSLTYDMGYIDDRDTRIDYQGSWAHYDSGSDYAGTETYSSVAGDSCTLTFEGTGVVFIGSKQNNTGKLKVYIDGEFKEEIDTYSNLGSALKQSEIYRIEGLENKEHTITIETCEGEYSCVVVDAFNVITPEGSGETEVSQLVINNQWYYPNLSWGNYTGQTGTMSQGMTGSATIRLTNGTNFTQEVVPSVTNLKVTDNGDKTLTASYDLRNGDENTEVSLQWYRIPVGDPASKAAAIDGAAEATLNVDGLEANGIYCVVTVLAGDRQVGTAQSNTVAVGMDYYQYYDILSDSPEFTFTGEAGTDYKTDLDMSWTANAYGKSVTYLLDSEEANNASVTFTFTGNGIRWVGGKENNQGIASVQIDDEPVVEVDLYGTATTGTQINEILFEKLWDEVGTHTITITRTGEKNENATAANVSLDAFIVINKETGRVIVDNLTVSQTAEGVLQADCEIRNGTEADVQFQWYAKDAYSAEGYARGEFTAVDGATGSTYTPAAEDAGKLFCCRATAGGATTESSALLVNAAMVDDTDESINYPADIIQDTTSKSYLTASDPYNDTVTYFRGGDLSFTFNGTGIVWIAGHDQAATNAMVSIDGNEAQSVNIPASDDGGWQFNQYEVFRVSDLEPGEHTIAIAAPGTEEKHSNLDAFMILNPGTASEEVSVQADGASGVQNLLMAPKLAPVVAGTAPTQEQIDAVIEELELAIEEFKASLYGRVPVESITLDTTELKLETGQTAKLNASVQPDNATDQTVVFSSSDETVVTVDAEGNVKAVGAGTAVITVTAENGSVTATCSVTVEDGGITPTPEPSETPEPEPSDTPEPTDEPNPSDTPEPTDEPNPSDTPDPTGTPGTGNKPGSGTGMGTGGGNTAGSGSGGTTSSGSGAQTGDNTPVLALGVAAALGAAGAVGLSVYRRRRKA